MTPTELDAKIEAVRIRGHEPKVILIELDALAALAESLKSTELALLGECAVRISTRADGKYSFDTQPGYPSGLQAASYREIPIIWYSGDLATSNCSVLAKHAAAVVA